MTEPLVWFFDMVAAGRLETTVHASSGSLAGAAYILLMWTFGFLRLSTGGFSAQAYGAGDQVQGRAVFQRAMLIGLGAAALCLILQWPYFQAAHWIFALQEGQQAALTGEFFYVRIWGAPGSLAFYVVIGWLVGVQKMRWIFILQLLLNLSNIGLNMLFVFGFGWGLWAIALASNLATYGALLIGLIMVARLKGVSGGAVCTPVQWAAISRAAECQWRFDGAVPGH